MIINITTKQVQTMSIHPDTNWMEEHEPGEWALVPDELHEKARQYAPFCELIFDGGELVDIAGGQPPFETLRRGDEGFIALQDALHAEINAACKAAIAAGTPIYLPDTGASEQFSLEYADQINITTALAAVTGGAAGFPYHADGQLCRVYSAADIAEIGRAAAQYIVYHTTYCNHMHEWIRREDDADILRGIVYGAALPDDLQASLDAILAAVAA